MVLLTLVKLQRESFTVMLLITGCLSRIFSQFVLQAAYELKTSPYDEFRDPPRLECMRTNTQKCLPRPQTRVLISAG